MLGAVRLARIATGELTWLRQSAAGEIDAGVITQPDPARGYQANYMRFRTLAQALTTTLAGVYDAE